MYTHECAICGEDSECELKLYYTDTTIGLGDNHTLEGKYCRDCGRKRMTEFIKKMSEI